MGLELRWRRTESHGWVHGCVDVVEVKTTRYNFTRRLCSDGDASIDLLLGSLILADYDDNGSLHNNGRRY